MSIIVSDSAMTRKGLGKTIVVGLGVTGLSCVRFLLKQNINVLVVDSRETLPQLSSFQQEFPSIEVVLGDFDEAMLSSCDRIILSPGVALSTPAIQSAVNAGVAVVGDIDLFKDSISAPLVAITGSNGKSTVTTLVGEMAVSAGISVAVGGNLGTPVLDLIDDEIQLYVVELSSFQLETTHNLKAEAAVLLNLSEDHMDRYSGKVAYHQAKQRIFQGCKVAVVNDDDPLSQPLLAGDVVISHYGLQGTDLGKFSVIGADGGKSLAKGFDPIIAVSELKIKGTHNQSNALAALALGDAVGIPLPAMLEALKQYSGLPHRCQWIQTHHGVDYINDSKGTNVGATETALNSLGDKDSKNIIWIAGGEGKGADFTSLSSVVAKYVKCVILMGEDAETITQAVDSLAQTILVKNMHEAVNSAYKKAESGDIVLLSPACASFDMFKNFEDRGFAFEKEAKAL